MRRYTVAVVAVSAAAGLWWALAGWMPRGAERFYLLAMPLLLALLVILDPSWALVLRNQGRSAALYFCVVLLACVGYSGFLSYKLTPAGLGSLWRRISIAEALAAAYFLITLKLLLTGFLTLFRRPLTRQLDRLLGPAAEPAARFAWARPVARNVLTEGPLLLLILPFCLAVLYVHRLKVPNAITPQEAFGRSFEEAAFTTTDGLTIRGWFIPAKEPSARTVVICHGLGANRANFLPFVTVSDALQANSLLFDFRGHGESNGHTVSYGHWEKLDVLAAIDYLRTQRPEQAREVVGLGISMGTAGLVYAAAEVDPPLRAIILDSAFASAIELTDSVLFVFPSPIRPALTAPGVPIASLHAGCWLPDVRPIDRIDRVRAPLLFVHAGDDHLIPCRHSERLYEKALEPKFLWISDTGGHGSSLRGTSEYLQRVSALLSIPRPGLPD